MEFFFDNRFLPLNDTSSFTARRIRARPRRPSCWRRLRARPNRRRTASAKRRWRPARRRRRWKSRVSTPSRPRRPPRRRPPAPPPPPPGPAATSSSAYALCFFFHWYLSIPSVLYMVWLQPSEIRSSLVLNFVTRLNDKITWRRIRNWNGFG